MIPFPFLPHLQVNLHFPSSPSCGVALFHRFLDGASGHVPNPPLWTSSDHGASLAFGWPCNRPWFMVNQLGSSKPLQILGYHIPTVPCKLMQDFLINTNQSDSKNTWPWPTMYIPFTTLRDSPISKTMNNGNSQFPYMISPIWAKFWSDQTW